MRLNLENSKLQSTNWVNGVWSGVRKILDGTLILTEFSNPVHFLDPNGGTWSVMLPTSRLGRVFAIFNIGGAGSLEVRNSFSTLLYTLDPGDGVLVISSDTDWAAIVGASGSISTGTLNIREVTAAGDVTVNAMTDDVVFINKTVGAATTVNLPAVAAREEYRMIKIVDGKLDADVNTITVVPNGSETILGLPEWTLHFSGDSVELWPRPDGTGWYT